MITFLNLSALYFKDKNTNIYKFYPKFFVFLVYNLLSGGECFKTEVLNISFKDFIFIWKLSVK